jgi:radical SAM superfamily enzyme YgiQ (UPF0313 family)
MPPLGPLHLAASARRHGHEPLFLDLALLLRRREIAADDDLIESCAERVALARPDVVGLTSMVSSLPAALHLAACLRRLLPDTSLILGGQGPEQVEQAVIARHLAVDAVAVGEADETFPQWLDALAAGHDPADVPGLVLRRDGRPFRTPPRAPLADLDAVDSPAWDLAESPAAYREAAGGDEALFPIDLGRGCTYSCAFCTTPVFWGRRARQLSPARAADEFDRLAALDGLDTVYVTHDLFTVDRDNVLAICAEKRARGNALPWECRTRLDLVDEELLVALREAGCRRILYGVESDTPSVLELVNKGGRSAQLDVAAALAMAARAGMASIVGTMAGVPGETEANVEANLRLMAEVAVIDGVSLSMHWFNVLPGNGQAAAVQSELHLHPGVHADLVRGHDLPPGRVPAEQRALITEDPELFAAFRVFPQPHADEASLYLLTRNAHLLLEVLPRTVRALAHARGATLLDTLLTFLRGAWAGTEAPFAALLADEREEHGEPFVEARVLDRESGVRLLSHWAATARDPALDALLAYERALFETEATHLARFEVDPLPLVRAMDGGVWPPAAPPADPAAPPADPAAPPAGPGAVVFLREGDAVRAHALSPLLADVFECRQDEAALRSRRPELDEQTLAQALALLDERFPRG